MLRAVLLWALIVLATVGKNDVVHTPHHSVALFPVAATANGTRM